MPDIVFILIILFMAAFCAALAVRLVLLRRFLRELADGVGDRLKGSSGASLSVSSRDGALLELARTLDAELETLSAQRARYIAGDAEVKNAVTNISHDLRTPLTAIAGYTELIKKEPLTERQAAYLERIGERTRAMTALTEELFRYSLVISEEECRAVEPVDLGAALESCLADHYERLKQKGIEPSVDLPETPVIRRLDRDALGRVFGNILNNAVKYSAGDLRVTLTEDGEATFANAAPDLTPVQAAKLFDRFYTVSTGRNSTGLGLSIAKTLTERMGGEICAGVKDGVLTVACRF